MINGISYQLPTLSLGFMIVFLIKILLSSLILDFSVNLVKGHSTFKKSFVLTSIMEVVNIIALPLFLNYLGIFSAGILSLGLYILIWLFLIMTFFEVSFSKALFIALIQGIITFVLVTGGVLESIGFVINNIILVK